MKIGIIGIGNMGSAIIGGMLQAEIARPEDITAADKALANLERAQRELGIHTTADNREAAAADVLFLAVKPNVLYSVIEEIRDYVAGNTLVISIAAGRTIGQIEAAFGKSVKLIRVMPNTPALVGEGMSALSLNAEMEKPENREDVELALRIFNSFGKAELVPESMMDAVVGVSGSAPAYVFLFLEAMADAAVQAGMPRAQAYTFAGQAVLGSAKMLLETGKHPGELKDMVCSPGGTTIDAVAVLEERGLRGAVMEAVRACVEKSKML